MDEVEEEEEGGPDGPHGLCTWRLVFLESKGWSIAKADHEKGGSQMRTRWGAA